MKIIINADDFGSSEKVNKAIYTSAKDNYISSATIMSIAPCLDEAVEMTKELKHISFGVHLTFDDKFPSLSGKPKYFDKNDIVNIKGLNLLKLNIICNEFSMQIEKLLEKGINISHLDTHQHIHLYPLVALAVSIVSKKYNINKTRSVRIFAKKSIVNKSYRFLHYSFMNIRGNTQPAYYTNFPMFIDENIYNKESNDIIEIMCHPGSTFNDEEYFNESIYTTQLKDSLINYHNL